MTKRVSPRENAATPAGEPIATAPVVVCMVASAGGLDAVKEFFQAMPADSGMAFVLVLHPAPRRKSLTPQWLAGHTPMPVSEPMDGDRIAPDRIYLIPPNRCLAIESGMLGLAGWVDGMQSPIDLSLRALADDQQERAICLVLSGSGSHGTLGLKAIKAAGGIALVQDPGTAEYDHMPRSAIAAGLADAVLPVDKMPDVLLHYQRHLFSAPPMATEPAHLPGELSQVIAMLRARAKVDFRFYRKGMLLRRVQRRMALIRADGLTDYMAWLRDRPDEVRALCKDLLISVTSFFRDPEMFQFLEAQAIPELLRRKPADAPVRVWVAGCATGEEAYSLAMLLLEQMGAAKMTGPLQVFASDIDVDALQVARRGVYPDSVTADVSPQRLARFFTKAGEHSYQVSQQLRDAMLFTSQNLLADAPFSRLDLVSCRNLLIYLEPEVQDKVLALLHFALNDGGCLLLGPAESIGHHAEMFALLSKRWRVYRRTGAAWPERIELPIASRSQVPLPNGPAASMSGRPLSWADFTRQLLLEEFAPAAVLVTRDGEVLNFSGATECYLRQPPGAPTRDLCALAHEGLASRVRAAMHKALRTGKRVSLEGGDIERNGRSVPVRVSAMPVRPAGAEGLLLLVAFEDEGGAGRSPPQAGAVPAEDPVVQLLEHELKSSREELQSAIEELESSNEELKAANEEVMSMNEELQSANEELSTVNHQLHEKVGQLEAAGNDIANLLTSADIATLFLGTDQRIRRFTPAATRLFNLIDTDIGRPLDDITSRFTDPELRSEVAMVLQTLSSREAEVRAAGGRWYIRRITPYRTADNRIDGAVLAFSDVSPLKQAEQELRQLSAELEQRSAELQAKVGELNRIQRELLEERRFTTAALETAGLLIAVLDGQGRIVRCNQACEDLAGQRSDALAGQLFSAAVVRREQRAQCAEWLVEVAAGRHPPPWEQTLAQRGGSQRHVSWFGNRMHGADGETEYLIAAGLEVTKQRRVEEEVRQRRAEVAHLHRLNTAGELAAALAHELNQPLAAMAGYADAAIQRLHRGAAAPQELVSDFEQIAQQAHRAARTIAELRRFLAKGEATRAAPCELNEMVRAARELMLADARLRQVDIELELAEDLPPVLAEGVQIEHVLTNLIINAMDAVRSRAASGGKVTVTTHAESATMAQVTVRDTGLGIAAGQTARIFEAFYTTKGSGLGMGLPISRSIVEAHEGKLWAESSRAGGIFHFTLPFAHGAHDLPG